MILFLSAIALAEDSPAATAVPAPVTKTWPHATTVVKDDGQRGSIALLVDCYPVKAGYVLADTNGAAMQALAAELAERTDKVVLMENPSAAEVRSMLQTLTPAAATGEDPRYAIGTLVLSGAGWNGDLNDDENPVGIVCRDWKEDVPSVTEAVALTEFAAAMPNIAHTNLAIFDASRQVPYSSDHASLGPVAEDWTLGFALSPVGRRQFSQKPFLPLLTSVMDAMPEGPIMAGDLLVALRQKNPDASAPIMSHGDLKAQAFGAKLETSPPPPTLPVAGEVTAQHFPTKPIVRWSGVGLAAVGIGLEAATIATLSPYSDCMDNPRSCYGSEGEYSDAYAKYSSTYDTWGTMQYVAPAVALTGVGLLAASFFLPDDPNVVTVTAVPLGTDGGAVALMGRW